MKAETKCWLGGLVVQARRMKFARACIRTLARAALVSVWLAALGASEAFGQYYAITDLGTLGGTLSDAYAINNNGQVVGRATTTGDAQVNAFLWSRDAGMSDLGTLGSGNTSAAYGINNKGQVVGLTTTAANANDRAFLWSKDGGMIDANTLLPSGTGWTLEEGIGINDSGQIVGYTTTLQPFVYIGGGGLTVFSGSGMGEAINDNSLAVGGVTNHAFLSMNGEPPILLGSLGGGDSYAFGINNGGQVVGWSAPAGGVPSEEHAFLWTSASGMIDLGTLPGGIDSKALGINNHGQVVGYATTNAQMYASERAFVVGFPYGGMTDLNERILPKNTKWLLQVAYGINDSGYIVGTGYPDGNPPNGVTHAFLLTPLTIHGARYSPGFIALSWSSNAASASASLQSNPDLTSTNWLELTNVIQFSNGVFQVILPATNPACFYRLSFGQ